MRYCWADRYHGAANALECSNPTDNDIQLCDKHVAEIITGTATPEEEECLLPGVCGDDYLCALHAALEGIRYAAEVGFA